MVMKMVRHWFRFSYFQNIKYFNIPMAFDIETSSFISGGDKKGVMWAWSLGIFGVTIQGRTWEEFQGCLDFIVKELKLNINKRVLIYVHNLQYEFGWMRCYFDWDKVFSIKPRSPAYALTTDGIEFRCSYLLSGYSLEKVGEHLTTYPIEKLTGTIDYSLIRTPETPRTPAEICYLQNDVKVVMAYIKEEEEANGGIALIPLTKTGYVRRYCRDACFYTPGEPKRGSIKRLKYRDIVKPLTITPSEYRDFKNAFQGGFTHGAPFFRGVEVEGPVESWDISSSYPTVMICEKYPMGPGEVLSGISENSGEFINSIECYCCIIVCSFRGLTPRIWYEHYLSESRCREKEGAIVDNGRIISADYLETTITNIDWEIIRRVYKWDECKIIRLRRYKRDYLPRDFLASILDLYEQKTTLKGVEGKEAEYMSAKEKINSCYGMSVTDNIGKPEIVYDTENQGWEDIQYNLPIPVLAANCDKYNRNPNRFLYYGWGIFVTAYARRNIWAAIFSIADDYLYSDTDSVKFRNPEKHRDFFDRYNKWIENRIRKACEKTGADFEKTHPKTIKGTEKPLGVFERDGRYSRFKSLGAKRYMVEYENGEMSMTVSGLNKSVTMPYLKSLGDPFELFDSGLYVPAEYTGKLTHTYIDHAVSGKVIDYMGIRRNYREESFIHLSGSDYSLSMGQEVKDFLTSIEF